MSLLLLFTGRAPSAPTVDPLDAPKRHPLWRRKRRQAEEDALLLILLLEDEKD